MRRSAPRITCLMTHLIHDSAAYLTRGEWRALCTIAKHSVLPPRKKCKRLRIISDGISFANVGLLPLPQPRVRNDLRHDPGKTNQAASRHIQLYRLRVRGPALVRPLRFQRLDDGDQAPDAAERARHRDQCRRTNSSTARLNGSGCSIGTEWPASAIATTSACAMCLIQRAINAGGA
jgi:hypothetical protein